MRGEWKHRFRGRTARRKANRAVINNAGEVETAITKRLMDQTSLDDTATKQYSHTKRTTTGERKIAAAQHHPPASQDTLGAPTASEHEGAA